MIKTLITLLVGIAVIVAPRGATAVVDPRPDVVGIYFDLNADIGDVQASINAPFIAYVLLTNPTLNGVDGFRLGYSFNISGNPNDFLRLNTELPPQSFDLGDSGNYLQGSYEVILGAPLPAAQVVTLVTWQFLLQTNLAAVLQLEPLSGSDFAEYSEGGSVVPMIASGACGGNFALVNQTCGVPLETKTFGNIKALYR